MPLNRIAPDQVLEAYRVSGLLPCRSAPYSFDRVKGCALGAIFHKNLSLVPEDHDATMLARFYTANDANKVYGLAYIDGFTDGWDEPRHGQTSDDETESYLFGMADGAACREAVAAEFGNF